MVKCNNASPKSPCTPFQGCEEELVKVDKAWKKLLSCGKLCHTRFGWTFLTSILQGKGRCCKIVHFLTLKSVSVLLETWISILGTSKIKSYLKCKIKIYICNLLECSTTRTANPLENKHRKIIAIKSLSKVLEVSRFFLVQIWCQFRELKRRIHNPVKHLRRIV